MKYYSYALLILNLFSCNGDVNNLHRLSKNEIEDIKKHQLSNAAKQKNVAKIIELSNLILRSDSNDYDALRNLGLMEQGERNYNEAIRYFYKAKNSNNNDEINMHLGTSYALLGDNDSAIYYLVTAFKINPMRTYITLASEHLREHGQFEKAIQIINIGIAKYPNDGKLLAYRASYFVSKEDYKAGLLDYNNAEKMGMRDHELYAGRAFALTNLEKFDLALTDINTAISMHKQDARYFTLRGLLLYSMKDYNKALEDFKIATQMGDPQGKENFEKLSAKLQREKVI